MTQGSNIGQILQWIAQPAFWVVNGIVSQVNSAASCCPILEGISVVSLIKTGHEEYAALESGSLFLAMQVGEQEWDACIHRMPDGDLFLMENTRAPELQAMALAAMKLRQPLSSLMAELDQMLPELSDEQQAGRINRRIHQILRIVGNMAAGNGGDTSSMELREVCGMLDEIFEKTDALAQALGIRLDRTVPNDRIYTVVSADRLERAVYNMLSNAIKASSPGGTVSAKVSHIGKRLRITVTDTGSGISEDVLSSVYTRYLRGPGLEPPDRGIGLGMSLIAATARLHGGTVLLETPKSGGTRVTMTLTIQQNWGGLRSSSLPVDYAGEQDHALVELSDVLPSSVYEY